MNHLKTSTRQDHTEIKSYQTVARMCSDFLCHSTLSDLPSLCLNTAVAYEDFRCGVRALQTFHQLFDPRQRPIQFDTRNVWKFDFLRLPGLRKVAVSETALADLIIVSVCSDGELPVPVKWWLESALTRRDGDPGALVLLHETDNLGEQSDCPVEKYLSRWASQSGLDFFVKREQRPPRPSSRNFSQNESTLGDEENARLWRSLGREACALVQPPALCRR